MARQELQVRQVRVVFPLPFQVQQGMLLSLPRQQLLGIVLFKMMARTRLLMVGLFLPHLYE